MRPHIIMFVHNIFENCIVLSQTRVCDFYLDIVIVLYRLNWVKQKSASKLDLYEGTPS